MERQLEGVKDVEMMIGGFKKAREGTEKKGGPKSDIYFWDALIGYYTRLHEANLQGKPIAGSGMFVPSELYPALDIAHVAEENHAILTAGRSQEEVFRLFNVAEGYGMSNEVCAPHRVALALAIEKRIPRPWFVVSSATTCDQTLKLYDILVDYYQVPSYMMDSIFRTDDNALEYAREDTRQLIGFLEEQSGNKLDYEKLKGILELSKEMYTYWEKLCELKKAVPCPIAGRDGVKDLGVMLSSCGRVEAVNYFKARCQELQDRVDKKEGVIPEEKHRIAWLYVLPLFDLGIADWLQKEYKANIVMDTFSYANPLVQLDTSDPIDYLAKKPLKWGFVYQTYGADSVTGFAKTMGRLAKEYSADCAIALAHWSCNQYCGTLKLLRDEISEQTGIPLLILDGDLLDSRVVSSAQMKNKLTEFFNMIEGKAA
jgi:benzoyl-CoA reductase/2-hydroxyglutaryl-CoA dehydratase subunit BcrC/BadD/HgdB